MDYRAVLATAAYPGLMRNHILKKKDPERYAQVVEEDRKQYEEWIEKIVKG